MSAAATRIELDTDSVRVGDVLTGRLHAETDATPGGPLTVELVWRTQGQCEAEEKVVDTAQVTFGDADEAPFSLTVPAGGPMSHVGRTLSITWSVRLAGGPCVEKSLTVGPAFRNPSSA